MKVLIWNENQHEKTDARVTELYPGGLHQFIAGILKSDTVEVRTATLDDEHCGITEEILDDTDVLIWWGHMAHERVPDDVVDMVQRHVLSGMGLFLLHSAHFSKIFKRLMGTTCSLKWRDGARERIWTIKPNHPIAAGVDETFVLDPEEMYGEPFDIPSPDGLRAVRYSGADAPGHAVMEESFIFSRDTRRTRPSMIKMCKEL